MLIGLKSQILGVWEFYVSKDGFPVDLGVMDTVCSHKLPNRIQIVKEGQEVKIEGKLDKYRVILSEPNVANMTLVTTGRTMMATWTMIYDQGLIVETNKNRFFANFKYTLKDDNDDLAALKQLDVGSYEQFNSECNKTMIGVV